MLIFSTTNEVEKINTTWPMQATAIIRDEPEVEDRLVQFGANRADWISVAQSAVAARNDATLFDPASAAGQFAYIHGTRAIRALLVPKGYEICREDNVESTYSSQRKLKVIYQNVDWAADPVRSPKAISIKGSASGRIIERSIQASLFPEWDAEDARKLSEAAALENSAAWYFAVSVDGDDVRAELSRPYPIVDGQFSGFVERIFILKPGDWSDISAMDLGDDGLGPEFEVSVSRK